MRDAARLGRRTRVSRTPVNWHVPHGGFAFEGFVDLADLGLLVTAVGLLGRRRRLTDMRVTLTYLSCLLMAANGYCRSSIFTTSFGTFFPNLQRTLDLTDAQWGELAVDRAAYDTFAQEKWSRLAQVNRELMEEKLRPEPSAAALGVRQLEIVSICRESTDRYTRYREALRRKLNPAQQMRLREMETAMGFLPSITEGQDLGILEWEVRGSLPPALRISDQPVGWRATQVYGAAPVPGCPSSFSFPSATLRGGNFSASQLYPNLIRLLDLTGGQFEEIWRRSGAFNLALAERSQEADQLRNEIEAESARPSPDASVLGAKAARQEQLCREAIELEGEHRRAIPNLLTEAQRARLQELERALQLLPALAEALQLNVTSREPGNALPPFFLSRDPVRRLDFSVSVSAGPNYPGCQVARQFGFF